MSAAFTALSELRCLNPLVIMVVTETVTAHWSRSTMSGHLSCFESQKGSLIDLRHHRRWTRSCTARSGRANAIISLSRWYKISVRSNTA